MLDNSEETAHLIHLIPLHKEQNLFKQKGLGHMRKWPGYQWWSYTTTMVPLSPGYQFNVVLLYQSHHVLYRDITPLSPHCCVVQTYQLLQAVRTLEHYVYFSYMYISFDIQRITKFW